MTKSPFLLALFRIECLKELAHEELVQIQKFDEFLMWKKHKKEGRSGKLRPCFLFVLNPYPFLRDYRGRAPAKRSLLQQGRCLLRLYTI